MRLFSAALAASLALASPLVTGHDDDGKAAKGDTLGKVKFANSCAKSVQAKLTRGVALLHSFWFTDGEETFREVLAQDPSCAIAHWGIASLLMHNPIAGQGASPDAAKVAIAELEKARATQAKTQRERDYIEAVSSTTRTSAAARSASGRPRARKAMSNSPRNIRRTTRPRSSTRCTWPQPSRSPTRATAPR